MGDDCLCGRGIGLLMGRMGIMRKAQWKIEPEDWLEQKRENTIRKGGSLALPENCLALVAGFGSHCYRTAERTGLTMASTRNTKKTGSGKSKPKGAASRASQKGASKGVRQDLSGKQRRPPYRFQDHREERPLGTPSTSPQSTITDRKKDCRQGQHPAMAPNWRQTV